MRVGEDVSQQATMNAQLILIMYLGYSGRDPSCLVARESRRFGFNA